MAVIKDHSLKECEHFSVPIDLSIFSVEYLQTYRLSRPLGRKEKNSVPLRSANVWAKFQGALSIPQFLWIHLKRRHHVEIVLRVFVFQRLRSISRPLEELCQHRAPTVNRQPMMSLNPWPSQKAWWRFAGKDSFSVTFSPGSFHDHVFGGLVCVNQVKSKVEGWENYQHLSLSARHFLFQLEDLEVCAIWVLGRKPKSEPGPLSFFSFLTFRVCWEQSATKLE